MDLLDTCMCSNFPTIKSKKKFKDKKPTPHIKSQTYVCVEREHTVFKNIFLNKIAILPITIKDNQAEKSYFKIA